MGAFTNRGVIALAHGLQEERWDDGADIAVAVAGGHDLLSGEERCEGK